MHRPNRPGPKGSGQAQGLHDASGNPSSGLVPTSSDGQFLLDDSSELLTDLVSLTLGASLHHDTHHRLCLLYTSDAADE